jgi:hypothetical protein
MTNTPKKINVLKNATSHYQSQIAGDMQSFHVDEWDCDIHFRSTTTLAQEAEVVELTRANKTIEALVQSIINKARHEDGSMMFTKHDKAALMNEVDPSVVLKVANKINGGALPSTGELEKN